MTSTEVCQSAGITYRQLDYWARAGRIPGVTRLVEVGSGNPRDWSFREFAFVMLLARLVKAGLRVEVASTVLQRQSQDLAELLQGNGSPAEVTLPGGLVLSLQPRLVSVPAVSS